MLRTLALISQKGGSGKTTLALALAAAHELAGGQVQHSMKSQSASTRIPKFRLPTGTRSSRSASMPEKLTAMTHPYWSNTGLPLVPPVVSKLYCTSTYSASPDPRILRALIVPSLNVALTVLSASPPVNCSSPGNPKVATGCPALYGGHPHVHEE